MSKLRLKTGRGPWVVSTSRYAGFRIKRVGFGVADSVFPAGTTVAFDSMPKGWRRIRAVEPFWLGAYVHSTVDDRVTLREVLEEVPATWREIVVAAHVNRVTYDAAKIARGLNALRCLVTELEEVRDAQGAVSGVPDGDGSGGP